MASPSCQEESVEPSKEGRFPFFSESAERHDPELSAELPILPMRDVALFPGVIGPLGVGRKASIQVVEHALREKKLVGLVAQRNPAEEHPQPADLYSIGTVVQLLQTQRHPDGSLRVLAQLKILTSFLDRASFLPRLQSAPADLALPPDWPGRQWEGRSCLWKLPRCAARAG